VKTFTFAHQGLTVGALVIVLACWWFGWTVEDLLTSGPLVVVDRQLANWLHGHATDAVTHAAKATTFFGSVPFLTGASVAVALFFIWQRCWYHLLTFVLTMGGGSLLDLLLKGLFHRPRPVFVGVTQTGYGFPSGHTMGATLFYGLLGLFLATSKRPWRLRVLSLLVAFLVIVLIGFSRICLGTHYLSDVMGAMAAGIAWFASCYTAVEVLRRRQEVPGAWPKPNVHPPRRTRRETGRGR